MIRIVPIAQLGEIEPGADLPSLLAAALEADGLMPGQSDVLVVSQKIVSKAENRFVDLHDIVPGPRARALANEVGKDARQVELILSESVAIVRAAPRVLITRHRSGHVMANAGIDQSNLGRGDAEQVLLLPVDADQSAAALREGLSAWFEPPPAIIVADSFGRPWRLGVVNVAIGAAGLPAVVDLRGQPDRDGRPLEVTQIALADQVAAAAGLALGEAAEGIPAALVQGLSWRSEPRPAADLLRPLAEDLFQ
jgi:coenzyme F420-0:L-glutamate ligase/coenzyme F420-1:gamma-L-glutamate ligase